jgi:cytochrome P450
VVRAKAITETLRMRPATPALGREVTEEVTIDDGRGRQFTLAKGTKISLSIYSAGMSPANGWTDPGTPFALCLTCARRRR